MQTRWPCPSCGAALRAEARHAGRRTRCPKCRQEVVVPEPQIDEADLEPVQAAPAPERTARSAIAGQTSPNVDEAASADERQPWEEMAEPPSHGEAPQLGAMSFAAPEEAGETAEDENDDAPFAPPQSVAELPDEAEAPEEVSPPVAKQAGAADSAAADEPDADGFLSAIVAQTKRPSDTFEIAKLSLARPPRQNKNRLLWIIGGCVAAALLVGAVVLNATGAFDSTPAQVEQPPPLPGRPLLVLDWPQAERSGGFFILDNTTYNVSQRTGPLEYPLLEGEKYRLHLRRLGSAPIDIQIPPQNLGQQFKYKPTWKPGSPADEVAILANSPDVDPAVASKADDKPVVESLRELKKWPTDVAAAKKEAGQEKKDILIAFFGADRRDWCYKLAKEVLLKPEFHKFADGKFTFVLLEAKGNSFDAGSPPAKLASDYHITSFPTIVLTDADGLAYAHQEYMDPGSSDYVKKFRDDLSLRKERDELLAATAQGNDDEKLAAAETFLQWLGKHDLLRLFEPKIRQWIELADRVDPHNDKGRNETMFLTQWVLRLDDAARQGSAEIRVVAASLEEWKKTHRFKDPNFAATIHLRLAGLLFRAGDEEGASQYVREALECGPTDPTLRGQLESIVGAANRPVSSGTGFAVLAGGFIVTNNHVVEGPGSLSVRLPGDDKKEVAARVIAADREQDIALIQLVDPDSAKLKPLPVLADTVGRGTSVAIFGYPLGDFVGDGLKLSQGVINALPDKGRDGMYLLDCNVNPGNSGGPLCDKTGQVVGLVAAKTRGGDGVGSYGMARPTTVVSDFLKAHLPGFQPSTGKGATKLSEWSDVDALVSPSVVMILKRPQ